MSESESILRLRNVRLADAASVGTKAAALGHLLAAGFPVPDGVVLSCSAYFHQITRLSARIAERLTADVIEDPGEIEPAAGEIRVWIEAEPWSTDLASELEACLSDWPARQSFAARTSLPSEELATAFGAGVTRAVLGLAGLENLRRGAAACWAALWTSRSIYYRYRKKIPQNGVALAVLVQPMIAADAAGVIYTLNRSTGDASEMQIESIWGLGEPLAQARVYPDRFRVSSANGSILESQIQEKTVRMTLRPDGAVEQQAVESEPMNAPSLAAKQITDLVEIARNVEGLMREPQDIEWALCGDSFYVLQARPIAQRQS